jgi:hypothetical protein
MPKHMRAGALGHLLQSGSVTAVIHDGTPEPQLAQRKFGSGSGAEESDKEVLRSSRPSRLPSAASLSQGGSSVDAGVEGSEEGIPELGLPTAASSPVRGFGMMATPGAGTGAAPGYKSQGLGAGTNSNAGTPAARPGTAGGAGTPGGGRVELAMF